MLAKIQSLGGCSSKFSLWSKSFGHAYSRSVLFRELICNLSYVDKPFLFREFIPLGHKDSCHVLFRELISVLFLIGKPFLLQEFIPLGHIDSCPVLFLELICNLFLLVNSSCFENSYHLVIKIVVASCFRNWFLFGHKERKIASLSCLGS